MYIEASSPRQAGDYADLHLFLSGSGELACLKFYYHMYGEDMGTLTVFSGNDVVFNASGNHGNYWKQATKNIYLRNSVSYTCYDALLMFIQKDNKCAVRLRSTRCTYFVYSIWRANKKIRRKAFLVCSCMFTYIVFEDEIGYLKKLDHGMMQF